MNQIQVLPTARRKVKIEPGQKWRFTHTSKDQYTVEEVTEEIKPTYSFWIVAKNVKFSSYNLVNLETGEFMFDKDPRSFDILEKRIIEFEGELVYNLNLSSVQVD